MVVTIYFCIIIMVVFVLTIIVLTALDGVIEKHQAKIAQLPKKDNEEEETSYRQWYALKHRQPAAQEKIVAVVRLPTGVPVIMPGHIDGDWFVQVSGSLTSLSGVDYWAPATEWELNNCWNLNNWVG